MVHWEDIHPNEQASLKERLDGRYSAPFKQTPWVEAPRLIGFIKRARDHRDLYVPPYKQGRIVGNGWFPIHSIRPAKSGTWPRIQQDQSAEDAASVHVDVLSGTVDNVLRPVLCLLRLDVDDAVVAFEALHLEFR